MKARSKRAVDEQYQAIRDRIAEQLRPMFEAGKLRGWLPSDDATPAARRCRDGMLRTADECAKRVRGLAEAFTVLSACPFAGEAWIEYDGNHPLRDRNWKALAGLRPEVMARVFRVEARGKAGWALMLAILKLARERRWYRARRGEEPSSAHLGIRRAA